MSNNGNLFPNSSDIETLIQDGNYTKIKSLMTEEGVFFQGSKRVASDHISRFVFGKDIYRRAFNTLVRATFGMSISGVRARVDKQVELEELFKNQIGVVLHAHKYKPRILQTQKIDEGLRVEVEYTKINPKFSEFNRKEIHRVDFDVSRLDDNRIEFRSLPKDAVDSLVARDVISNSLNEFGCETISNDIEELPIKFRVKLFDDIINLSKSESWRVEEVCGLSIRAGDSQDDDADLGGDKMKVLQSAILKGTNLRDHPIVEELIADDYYFSAISFWTKDPSAKGSLDQLRVNIEFKRKPQVLIVNVADCRTPNLDAEVQLSYKDIPPAIGRGCILFYWDLVNLKYEENKKEALKPAVKVKKRIS